MGHSPATNTPARLAPCDKWHDKISDNNPVLLCVRLFLHPPFATLRKQIDRNHRCGPR
jgi:hypothetical protein